MMKYKSFPYNWNKFLSYPLIYHLISGLKKPGTETQKRLDVDKLIIGLEMSTFQQCSPIVHRLTFNQDKKLLSAVRRTHAQRLSVHSGSGKW
nr:hypothetical transcript [Hymenolepis microstoma]